MDCSWMEQGAMTPLISIWLIPPLDKNLLNFKTLSSILLNNDSLADFDFVQMSYLCVSYSPVYE